MGQALQLSEHSAFASYTANRVNTHTLQVLLVCVDSYPVQLCPCPNRVMPPPGLFSESNNLKLASAAEGTQGRAELPVLLFVDKEDVDIFHRIDPGMYTFRRRKFPTHLLGSCLGFPWFCHCLGESFMRI